MFPESRFFGFGERAMWPRSIRARVTLIAAILSGVVLCLLGVGTSMLIRNSVEAGVFEQVQSKARKVSADVRAGTLPNPIAADGTEIVQLVDSHGVVTNASL